MINWREYIESDPKVMYGKPLKILIERFALTSVDKI